MIERARAPRSGNTPQVWTRVAASPAGAPAPPAAAGPRHRRRRRSRAGRHQARRADGGRATGRLPRRQRRRATATDRERWSNGTSTRSRTSAGRPRFPASRTPARSSGATACSSSPPSAAPATRPSEPGSTATSRRSTISPSTPGRSTASTRRPARSCGSATAFKGAPKVKRHTKASQANSTPVTDGRRVVAIFGSIGMLAAWDMDGKPLWKTTSACSTAAGSSIRTTQWGHSSSPIIHGDKVIVQADRAEGLVHRRLRRGRPARELAHRARRDLDLGHADRLPAPATANRSSPTGRRSAATTRRPASCCGRSGRTPK